MKDKRQECVHRLRHIQKAIADIQRFVQGASLNDFEKNELLHHTVLMQFIIIGEAIKHVDDNVLTKYSYPWYKVKAFRNLIAHEYFNIKLSAVWQTVVKDIPVLKLIIERMIEEESKIK